MNITVRIFMYNSQEMQYDSHVHMQWVLPSGSPTPHVGEYVYLDDDTSSTVEVKEVTYVYPDETFDHIMIDLMVKKVDA